MTITGIDWLVVGVVCGLLLGALWAAYTLRRGLVQLNNGLLLAQLKRSYGMLGERGRADVKEFLTLDVADALRYAGNSRT